MHFSMKSWKGRLDVCLWNDGSIENVSIRPDNPYYCNRCIEPYVAIMWNYEHTISRIEEAYNTNRKG